MREKDARGDRVDPDGVRVLERNGRAGRARFLVSIFAVAGAVVVLLSATAVLLLRREPGNGAAREERRIATPSAAPSSAGRTLVASRGDRVAGDAHPAPSNRTTEEAAGTADPPPPAEREPAPLERLARGVIEGLKLGGGSGGLAAFPPPGTDPIKTGLVVPDDFELPEGYIRYHQVTDDGRRLDPILMFSPDYEFVDASDHPVELPKDGIVPPDMVPPGLPVRMLDVPQAARTPDGGSR